MISEVAKETLDFVSHYGIFGIFILMFLENIGLPVPTEIGFIVGQTMVVSGQSTYFEILLVILLGSTAGSVLSYLLGTHFAGRIKLYDGSNRIKKAQEVFHIWLEKYDSFAVFISRLVGYIRPWSSYLAGIGEVKIVPFLIYNILGSIVIFSITMAVLGGVVEVWQTYPILRPLAVVIFLLLFIGFWIGLGIFSKAKKNK